MYHVALRQGETCNEERSSRTIERREDPMQKKYILKEETRKRCTVLPATHAVSRKLSPISLELFPLLREAKTIPFALYVRTPDEIVEYIRPTEFALDLLEDLWSVLLRSSAELEVCVLKKELALWENTLDTVRKRKVRKLLEQDPTLDPKVLDIFSDISSVSQLMTRGGLTSTTVRRATAAAAYLVAAQLNSEITVGTLSRMIYHDPTLYDHSASVAIFAACLAAQHFPHATAKELSLVAECGLYHDTGKSCISHHILNKPGVFTPEEFAIMKTHAIEGHRELVQAREKGAPISPEAAIVALEHHERFRGHGYPHGKKGRLEEDPTDGIHLYARIVSIADTYSALLMKRVYKDAVPPLEALKIMKDCADRDFDPVLFSTFCSHLVSTQTLFEAREKARHTGGRILVVEAHEKISDVLKRR